MGARGPTKGTHAARRCGPHGLAASGGKTVPGFHAPAKDDAAAAALPALPTEPPSRLPAAAKRVYRENLTRLVGRATAADLEAYCRWCQLTAEYWVLTRSRSKRRLNEMRAHSRVLFQLEMGLGLVPAGRARLPEPKAGGELDGDEATQASQLA